MVSLHPSFHSICWVVEAVDTLLSTFEALPSLLQQRLSKAQAAMKHFADTKCKDVTFSVGDWVYVRLRPYWQHSIAGSYHKLSKHFYSPIQIIEQVDSVAYRLQLPASSKIHPVFHCSLLKAHQGPLIDNPAPLSSDALDNRPLLEPLSLLDWKWDTTTSPPTKLVLVQWLGLAPEGTTLESWDKHLHCFSP